METIKDITGVILYVAVIGLVGYLAAACLAGCAKGQGGLGNTGVRLVLFWQESGIGFPQTMS